MIVKDFVLRKMPGMNIVMPTGSKVKGFNGALMLNDTGAFIFEKLKNGMSIDETADLLSSEYDVSLEKAKEDTEKTVSTLTEAKVIE